MATKKTLGVTNEIENLITNAITTEIQSAIEESKSKATRKKGSVNIETEIIITPEMVFNLNEVQTQLAQMKETFKEAYDVIKQYNEDLNYDLEKSFKARIPDILSLKNKFDALRSTINSNQGEKINKFDIGMSKKTLERLYEELQSEYDAMSSNFRKAHPIIKVDEWMAPITSELYDSIEKLKKEAAGSAKEISESMEKIVEEIEKPVKKKSKKKTDIGDQLQETAQKAKSAVKELSEVNGKVKEFYDTFGSPTKALDIGYFASLEEVLKTLGGTFEEFKESEDAFDESRVNLEFFKELAKQTMLTNDEVEELQKSFSELNFLLSDEASKFSSSVSIGKQVTEELDKIQKIFNGEFFQSNPMEDFFPMGELEEDLDSVENEVEEFSDHLTKGMSKSRNYVIDLKTAFLNLIDNIQQLNSEDDPEWIDRYNDDINELLSKYPELEKFKNQFSTLSDARDFIKTDAWYDFLGTLPKAREYLEEIGESDRIVASQPITINSSKNIEEEKEMVEQTSKAFDVASESKIDFVKANENVANAAENSVEPINREAEAARDLSEAFKNAADSKRQFIEANKELANTTNNSTSSIEEAATNLVNAGLKAAAAAQDSNSPSKKYDKLGKDAVDGYANGIKEKTEEVNKAVSSMVESGIDTAKESSLIDKETTALEKLNEQLREYNKLKDKDQRSVARNSMAQFMLDNGIGLDQLTKSQQKILSSTYNKLNQSNLLSNVESAVEGQNELQEELRETTEVIEKTTNNIKELELELDELNAKYQNIINSEEYKALYNKFQKIGLKEGIDYTSEEKSKYFQYSDKLDLITDKITEIKQQIKDLRTDNIITQLQEAYKTTDIWYRRIHNINEILQDTGGFFASNLRLAASYFKESDKDEQLISAILDKSKFLTLDAGGRRWDDLLDITKPLEVLVEEKGINPYALQSEKNNVWRGNTKYIAQLAQALGYLGVEIQNVIDVGAFGKDRNLLGNIVQVFDESVVSNVKNVTEAYRGLSDAIQDVSEITRVKFNLPRYHGPGSYDFSGHTEDEIKLFYKLFREESGEEQLPLAFRASNLTDKIQFSLGLKELAKQINDEWINVFENLRIGKLSPDEFLQEYENIITKYTNIINKTSVSSSTKTEIENQNELQQELHETAEAVEEVTQAEEKQKKVRLYKDKSGQYTFVAQGKQKKKTAQTIDEPVEEQIDGQYTIDDYLKTLPTTQADWVLSLPRISKEAVQQQSELNHQIELTNTNMQRLVSLLQLTYKIREAFLKDIHMSTGEQNERLLLSGTKPIIDAEYTDVTDTSVAETAKATAEATAKENAEMNDLAKTADKATTAKKKFAKANKEDAQSAKETTAEVKEENEAFDETGNSVDNLVDKLKDLEKEQKGYIRVQQGRNDDANNRYTEALSDFVDKRVTKTTDPLTGKVSTQEQYLISYDKIARKLIAIDKKRLDWIHKIENANEEQIQALQAGLIEIENERDRLENVFNEIVTNRDLYVADANQIEIVRERRRIAEILNESEFNAKNTGTPSINKQITTMITNMNQLKTISKDLFKGDETSVDRFINQLRNVNKLYEVLITKGTQTTQNKTNKAFDTAFEQMSKSIFNSKEFAQLGKGEQSYFKTIFNRSSIQDLIAFSQKLNEFRRKIIDTKTELTTYKPTFIEKFGSALKSNIGRLATTYLSITDLVRYFRQAVQAVTELDSALTELRVVSNASDYVLKDISKQAFQLGQRLGSTTAEVVKSITDWRRLGETVENSLALAEQAARLSVGGLMEVSTATESLVSAMKAYGYAVEDVSQIVDKFIYIGNNYSITSEDLATSLEKSSGALVAAGNSLEEAVALEVAGNTVIQDANAVSNALKAISMRLRGTSGSALEEIGEDTEGLVENASKLYEIVKRLTTTASNPNGVEIINKANNSYKSTYQILLEISKVWGEIGDIQQAELLEKLAGKVRGSAVAAILSQGDILENAYYDAMNNAEGAGEKAIENSLNSIEKKLQQFKNETKNLMTDVIESNTIKGFIDFGTQVISVLDKIIPKISLLGSVLGTLGGGLVQKLLTRGSSLKEFFGFSHFFKMFNQDDWKHLNKYFTALKSGKTQVEALQTSMVGASRMATNFAKKIDADSASLRLLSVKAKLGAQGLTLLKGATVSLFSISIGVAITALVTYLSDLVQAEKDVVKNANELFDKYDDGVKKIEDYNKEIKKLTDQLNDENITQSEAYQIRSDLYDIQQDLIKSYGFEADALDLLNKKYDETNNAIKEKLQLNAKDILDKSYEAYNKAIEELNENKSYFLGDYSSLVGGITNNDIFNDQQFLNDISPYAYEFNNPVHRGLSFTLRSTLKDSEKDLKAFSEMLSKYYDKYPDLVKGVREEIANQLTKLSKDEDYQADIKQIDEYSNALMQSTDEYYEYSKAISEYKSAVIAGDAEQIQKSINQITEYKDKVKDLAYTDMSAADNETVRSAFTDMLDIDFSQGYRQVFQKGLLDLDNKELQDALKKFADENEGAWSKTIADLQFGGKNGLSEAYVNAMLDSLNIPKTEKNIDLALEELVNYFNESGKATLEDAKPLTYEKWLQATSNIKKDDKTNYTNAEAQEAYKTAISQITDYAKKNPNERINFTDMFHIAAGDELFKQLHMDEFKKYLKDAGYDSIKAVILYAQDALDSFDETIDLNMSEEDKKIFKSQMLDIQMAALGASDNILVLEDSYNDLKDILDQVDEGWKEEDLKPIIEQYTELAGDVEYLENGMVTLRKDGVESLINTVGTASNKAITSMQTIIDKFGESSDIIQNFYKQIKIAALETALANYKVSMSALDIWELYERAKNEPGFEATLHYQKAFGEDTDKVLQRAREIDDELKGVKLKETDTNHSGSGSGSGNKKTDNEIDWIANSLENIQKEIDKTQEKYDRLFTTSGSDKKLAEANGFLTDINNLLDKQIKGFDIAAKAYEKELNALGLSSDELDIIKNVALDNNNAWMIERFNTDNEDDQKKYERLQEGLKFYQNEQDAYAKMREKMHQKEENNIQALQNEYDNLGAKIAQVEAQLTPETSIKKQQKYNEELIDLYTQQYDKEIQIAYAKGELIKATELQAAKEQKVNELIAQGRQYSIDAVTARYDRLLGEYENRQRVLEHGIAMTEGQGSLVSTNYYKALIDNERATINDNLKARDEMVDRLHQIEADGIYSKEDLEQWQAAKDKIDDITGSIYESEEAILSWKNAMRQVEWDVFDRIQETIGRVADEADYLIESLSSKDLFEWTKEIWGTDGTQTKVFYGDWADEGIATLGLHQLKIADYKEQVENYREEIRRLYKDIAKNPTDLTLIDRKNQLIDAERQLALSVKQEEQAILDLVRDGYDKQLNSLQELINKYNEALASEKD